MKNVLVYTSFIIRAISFLILAPIFTRFINPNNWGAVLSTQALVAWLTLLLEFGFGLSAVRRLSIVKENSEKTREIFGEVFSAKILLSVMAFLFATVISLYGTLSSYPSLVLWGFILAVIQGFMPIWYFQATEKLYIYSLIDLCSRMAYLLIAFLLIKSNADFYYIISLLCFTSLCALLIMLWLVKNEIHGWKISFRGGVKMIKEGSHLASFTLVTSVYSTASVLLFGLFVSPYSVALYGNADRLVRAGISLIGPLNQIILPRTSRAFHQSESVGFSLVKKVLSIYIFFSVFVSVIGYFVAPYVVNFLFGNNYMGSVLFVRWLIFLFPLIAVNTVITYHIFVPLGLSKTINRIYIFVSIISLLEIILLVPRYGGMGMIAAMLSPEVIAFILLFLFLRFRVSKKSMGKLK